MLGSIARAAKEILLIGPIDDNSKTVLLAEDEEPIRTLILTLLQRSGYNVIIGVDGQDAIKKSRQFKGAINLLLSDINMPNMTGVELATQVRIDRPGIQILLMSGVEGGLMPHNDDWQFLQKPFRCDILRQTIQRLLQDGNHGLPRRPFHFVQRPGRL